MKPRQGSAALTREDHLIWGRVCYRFLPKVDRDYCPETWGILADRRDADLMLHAEQSRGYWLTPAEAWTCEWGCVSELCDDGCYVTSAFPIGSHSRCDIG